MSYINNPDITKEDILKKSLAHWNVGKTQEWIDRDMAIVMGKREGYYFWDIWIINITHRLPLFYNTYVTAAINYTILYWLLALSNLLGVSEVFFLKSFIKCAWS